MYPSVYKDSTGKVVIALRNTTASIYIIEVDEQLQHTVTAHRIAEFHQNFTQTQYPVAQAAQKFLTRKHFTCSEQASKELKEIVMNYSNVIAVNPAAEFLGRFASVEVAASCTPPNSLFITSEQEFEGEHFTKSVLAEALGVTVDKKVTKATLASELFAKYQAQEATVMEKEKKVKKEKVATVKEPGVMSVLRAKFEAGDALNVETVAEELAKSPATVRSMINKLKSEANCGEGGPLAIVSGKQSGNLFYVLESHKDSFEWDATAEKQSRAKGEPRAPKTDGPVYKVHEYCNANPGVQRKEVIAALVEMGINKSTATTQYGVWKAAQKTAE